MTDNDIIKALEECEECHYFNECEKSTRLALGLINRQKAEIERLQNLKSFEKFIAERIHTDKKRNLTWDFKTGEDRQKAFEEELEKLFDIATSRAEAIKEFAERLKEEFPKEFDAGLCYALCAGLDNLVKEMVGDV